MEAKKKMKIAIKAIWALTAGMLFAMVVLLGPAWVLLKPMVTPMMATKNWQTSIPRAPQLRKRIINGQAVCDPSNDLHKKGTASESLNGPEGDRGGEHVDESEDKGDEEGVGDGSSGLEERGREVKDEVDTRPLLHHLERSAKDGASEVAASLPKRAREALGPAGPVASGGDHLSFVLGIGDDLGEFGGDVVRVLGLTTKPRKHGARPVYLVFLDKETGRLRKEVKTSTKDQTPSELDTNRDAV